MSCDDVRVILDELPRFVREAGLWYGSAHDLEVDDAFVRSARAAIEDPVGH